ncbi:MAG: biotin--[acetyl-CoA-carboxylase] ligase [Candidatus Pelagibacter sp. TMED153]|nr:MAG: biotin--[acetyl-CoA-carboxylase] ligase [Candidatus Pelagibacter sp. TMED153]|tara:strand:- start:144 stop:707 length:564 start_codon:yes stop_codon:yes gene_type:complete
MKIKLIKFKSVKSTNDEAYKLIKKNMLKPTLITTENQTKGRGTMGKKWISLKGNLFLSIFFVINNTKINYKQFALLNAYLIRNILSKYVLKKITIKWPNDLLIKKEKICGILQETIQYKEKHFLIIGVGINTYNSPKIKNFKTSSLQKFTKKKIDNNKILFDIKKKYEKLISGIEKYQFSYLKEKLK